MAYPSLIAGRVAAGFDAERGQTIVAALSTDSILGIGSNAKTVPTFAGLHWTKMTLPDDAMPRPGSGLHFVTDSSNPQKPLSELFTVLGPKAGVAGSKLWPGVYGVDNRHFLNAANLTTQGAVPSINSYGAPPAGMQNPLLGVCVAQGTMNPQLNTTARFIFCLDYKDELCFRESIASWVRQQFPLGEWTVLRQERLAAGVELDGASPIAAGTTTQLAAFRVPLPVAVVRTRDKSQIAVALLTDPTRGTWQILVSNPLPFWVRGGLAGPNKIGDSILTTSPPATSVTFSGDISAHTATTDLSIFVTSTSGHLFTCQLLVDDASGQPFLSDWSDLQSPGLFQMVDPTIDSLTGGWSSAWSEHRIYVRTLDDNYNLTIPGAQKSHWIPACWRCRTDGFNLSVWENTTDPHDSNWADYQKIGWRYLSYPAYYASSVHRFPQIGDYDTILSLAAPVLSAFKPVGVFELADGPPVQMAKPVASFWSQIHLPP